MPGDNIGGQGRLQKFEESEKGSDGVGELAKNIFHHRRGGRLLETSQQLCPRSVLNLMFARATSSEEQATKLLDGRSFHQAKDVFCW